MANQQHIEWLLEGAGSWNRRREAEDFESDFARAKIRDAFLATKGSNPAQQVNRPILLLGVNLTRVQTSPTQSLETPC